jgi:hypothetical protein
MFEFLMTALSFSVFAMTSVSGPALSQYKLCHNIPKSGVPCIVTPQAPQLPKPQGT